MLEQIQMFRVIKPMEPSKAWRNAGIKSSNAGTMPVGQDEEHQSYYKIEMCLSNKEIQRDLLTIFLEVEGVIKEGAAPPLKPIGELKKALRSLRRPQ